MLFTGHRRVAAAVAAAVVLAMPAGAQAATPDLTAHQGYLQSAEEGGIDARSAWLRPGGTGGNVTVLDVEYVTWNLEHEDLPADTEYVPNGAGTPFDFSDDHGTQVVGTMVADDNGYGMTGIVPDAALRVVPHWTNSLGYLGGIASAIRTGASVLQSGDVLLVEANMGGPNGQDAPVEWSPTVYAAVAEATDAGIIVVETAGNGGKDLDAAPPSFEGYGDSGAIVVGAGASPRSTTAPPRSALSFSNYGARVDLQGWGQHVATTGRGDLHGGGGTPCNSPVYADRYLPGAPSCRDDAYTASFSGTSSAGPIVAGAAAALSSIAQEQGRVLTPREVRGLLVDTGTPQEPATGQSGISRHIGPLPDLEAAVAELFARYDRDGDGIFDTDPPTSLADCKGGAWRRFNNPTFRNQGSCVSFVAAAGQRDG